MSLPRMSWHIGDYKKDTGHLRAAGHGAYFLLCMHYWATGGLPNDDKQLASIACMTDREWKAHRDIIKALFKGEGEWRHKRVEEEISEAQAKYEKRVAAGKKGGKAKAAAKQSSSNATAKPYQPITDNREREEAAAASGASASRLISEEAWILASELASIAGHEPAAVDWPPTWAGAPMRIQAWLNEGWKGAVILVAARAAAGKKPPKSINRVDYFEGAIADEHARQAKPIPKTEVSSVQTHQPAARSGKGGGFASFARDRSNSSG